jgi:predicted nucleic acid-binding protein
VKAYDEADNRYLECAVAGEAKFIVIGDIHLLELQEYQGIIVLPPAGFLELLQSEE